MKKNRDVLILCLVLQAAVAFLFSRIYLQYHNTLSRNGNWVSSKPSLAVEVMGAFSFTNGRQALAMGRLNLGTWYGFHEVLCRDKLHLQEIEFDFLLGPHAYLNFIFNKTADGFSGIRLSATSKFESIYFRATDEGQFTRKVQLDIPGLRPALWHRLKLSAYEKGFTVFLDDREIGSFEEPFVGDSRIGFRGGMGGTSIDNIVLHRLGADTLYESFDGLRGSWRAVILSLLAMFVANGVFYVVLRKMTRLEGRHLGFSVASVNILLLFAGLLLFVYGYYSARRYPVVDEGTRKQEEDWKEMRGRQMLERIERRYGMRPDADALRILFLGTSQTWGAGASEKGKTIVGFFRKMLEQSESAGVRYECINGSVPAAVSSDILILYDKKLRRLEPAVVVINLSNNEGDLEEFEANLRGLLKLILEDGAQPVLIMEPNSIEYNIRFLRQKHEVMEELGEEFGVPVIDMQSYLSDKSADGFLWWDKVHLTSLGQRLFAEKLYGELEGMLRSRARESDRGRAGGEVE